MIHTEMHTVSGKNAHGPYEVKFWGPIQGFVLSDSQVRRWKKALCGILDCPCREAHVGTPHRHRTGGDGGVAIVVRDAVGADGKPAYRLMPWRERMLRRWGVQK